MASRASRAEGWRVLAVGVTGFALGLWVGRAARARRELDTVEPLGWADRWGDRVDAAMDVAADGFRSIERRWSSARAVEPDQVTSALRRVPGADALRARVLGTRVVDVEGEASDAVADEARRALRDVDGVEVVLNRIWTPSSALPAAN